MVLLTELKSVYKITFAITLCRAFITLQKISTPKTFMCHMHFFKQLVQLGVFSVLCVRAYDVCMCVCVCVCVCVSIVFCIFDDLQTTPLSEIPKNIYICYKLKPDMGVF